MAAVCGVLYSRPACRFASGAPATKTPGRRRVRRTWRLLRRAFEA